MQGNNQSDSVLGRKLLRDCDMLIKSNQAEQTHIAEDDSLNDIMILKLPGRPKVWHEVESQVVLDIGGYISVNTPK
jgi:hypothetical protein